MSVIRKIVQYALNLDSSDIHLEEESPIAIRVNSDIQLIDKILYKKDMDILLGEILDNEKLDQLCKNICLIIGWSLCCCLFLYIILGELSHK